MKNQRIEGWRNREFEEACGEAVPIASTRKDVDYPPTLYRSVQRIKGYVLGLADMYVEDPRFAANYGGVEGAGFVRAALRSFAEKYL